MPTRDEGMFGSVHGSKARVHKANWRQCIRTVSPEFIRVGTPLKIPYIKQYDRMSQEHEAGIYICLHG